MALGLSTSSSGGDFLPIVKWDARAGRMFRVDRKQGLGGWESEDVDITNAPPKFAIDFGSIETGFICFAVTGPDFRMAPLGAPMQDRPSKDHKPGFRVKIAGQLLGGVREFSHTAKSVLSSMDALHSTFENAPEAVAGQIPVIEIKGSTPIVTNGPQGKVTSYAPIFEVVGWTERLAEFGPRTVAAPRTAGAAPAAAAHTNHVPPPVAHVPPPAAAPAPAGMPF